MILEVLSNPASITIIAEKKRITARMLGELLKSEHLLGIILSFFSIQYIELPNRVYCNRFHQYMEYITWGFHEIPENPGFMYFPGGASHVFLPASMAH